MTKKYIKCEMIFSIDQEEILNGLKKELNDEEYKEIENKILDDNTLKKELEEKFYPILVSNNIFNDILDLEELQMYY